MAKARKRRIVILGGGFAGVECARKLESHFGDGDGDGVELVMVSEDNFLLFTPMLPQVASGMIETRHIIMPIPHHLRAHKVLRGARQEHRPVGQDSQPVGDGRPARHLPAL